MNVVKREMVQKKNLVDLFEEQRNSEVRDLMNQARALYQKFIRG